MSFLRNVTGGTSWGFSTTVFPMRMWGCVARTPLNVARLNFSESWLEVRLVKAVWNWQRREARRHGATGTLTGSGVCFSQWFGSQLQLTPHLHLLAADAMWQADGTVVPVAPPSDEEVARILARVLRAAKKDWADQRGGLARRRVRATAAAGHSGAPGPRRGSDSPAACTARRGAGGLLAARGHRCARPRQTRPRAAGQVRLARPGVGVTAPSSRRRPLRVLAEEGHGLHAHRERPRASPRRPPSPSPAAPHLVPWRLRPQRQAAPARHPTAPAGDDTSAGSQPSPLGGPGPETEAAPPGLGRSFISTPSATTCCAAPAEAGAPSARSTRRASKPRPVSPSSASRFLLGCCLQPPLPRNCSSPCDGQRIASRRRGAVPPCLRRHALATPENRLPRRPSPNPAPLSQPPCPTSASDPPSQSAG